jgi:hypothetical protein
VRRLAVENGHLACEAGSMEISVNDLVVRLDSALDRIVRVTAIEPWPTIVAGTLIEDATALCHGTMIVFDRLVPMPATPIRQLRRATAAEIAEADRQDLLPPKSDDGQDNAGDSGQSRVQ